MALHVDFAHPLRSFDARVELTVAPGSTTALVGPSGAGKSTVLRVVAGLLRPHRGTVSLDGHTWLDTERGIDVPPERRATGFVFQDYALFPHLDVAANVRFGARTPARVAELLERFGVSHLTAARVHGLSGGERQRVALARALAREPAVLLLDEPLAALDVHTKAKVRAELHELLAGLELPCILVTHDFEDAAALAGRVGVMVGGRLLQQGTASELVARPADPFVASFTGATLLEGTAGPAAGGLTEVVLDTGGVAWSTDAASGRVAVAVHPWDVALARRVPADSAVNHLRAPVSSVVEIGNTCRVRVGPLVAEITVGSAQRLGVARGEILVATFKATATRLLSL